VLEHSGECSRANAARLLAQLESLGSSPDHVIGFGGACGWHGGGVGVRSVRLRPDAHACTALKPPAHTCNTHTHTAGKLMDITKLVAAQLGLPVVILPSLASTDAPCLGASIVYSDGGE
jgi:hypothetical protein